MIPDRATPVTAGRTGYGSVTVLDARASRIYVAGRHDTELIAQVCVSGAICEVKMSLLSTSVA